MRRRSAFLSFIFATLIACPSLAQGQPLGREREKAAQVLFDQGMDLMKQKKLAEACPKFEDSLKLDPAMGTTFRLAECYEGIGRRAKAWGLYKLVAADARARGEKPRETFARKHLDAIEPKLARLTILVSAEMAALPGLVILRDGEPVDRAEWGASARVDTGEHSIQVTAPQKTSWAARSTNLAPGTNQDIVVPRLEDDRAPLPVAPVASSTPPVAVVTPFPVSPPLPPPPPKRSIVPAIVLGSVAVAGVGVGVAGMVVYASKHSTANDLKSKIGGSNSACSAMPLPANCADLKSALDSQSTFLTLGMWGFIGAGVTGIAAVAYAAWPEAKAPGAPHALQLLPSFDGRSGGAVVRGAF